MIQNCKPSHLSIFIPTLNKIPVSQKVRLKYFVSFYDVEKAILKQVGEHDLKSEMLLQISY